MKAALYLAFAISATMASAQNVLTPAEKQEGFRLLFDGKSLENFRNYQQKTVSPLWQVKDGAITLTQKGGGNLMTKEKFRDFELRFDFKISAEGNSGVMWRVTEDHPHPFHTGPEFQILDSFAKTEYENERAIGNVSGAFYGIIPAKPEISKPAGEWNSAVIHIKGTKITLTLNGVVTADIDSTSEDYKKRLAVSKFASWQHFNKQPEGHLAFQDHNDVVSFRNLRIRTF